MSKTCEFLRLLFPHSIIPLIFIHILACIHVFFFLLYCRVVLHGMYVSIIGRSCKASTDIYVEDLVFIFFFNSFYIEGKGRRQTEKTYRSEKHRDQLPLVCVPTVYWSWTRNPASRPNQESNWRPFALWDNTPPTEPHRPGLCTGFYVGITSHDSGTYAQNSNRWVIW